MLSLGQSLRSSFLVLIGLSISLAAATPGRAIAQEPRRIVSVNGSVQIDVAPDVVDVSITLQLQRPTPKAAMIALQAQRSQLIKSLQTVGLSSREIRLGYVQLLPVHDRYPNTDKLIGFRAWLKVTVCLSRFSRLSGVMQAAANAGAAQMSTHFRTTRIVETKNRARILAVQAARRKAEQLVRALGGKLGRVTRITERQQTNIGQLSLGNVYVRPTSTTKPLSPGAIAVSLSVAVEFEIR